MTAPGLTRRQRECMMVIQEFAATAGVAPTIRELAHELECASIKGVVDLLRRLEERGAIRRLPGQARAIEILRPIPMPEECEVELTPAALELLSATAIMGE